MRSAFAAFCCRITLVCGACAILGLIEEMKDFDLKLLDQRSYGLDRTYPECPNYSDEFTQQAIEKRLDALLNHRRSE